MIKYSGFINLRATYAIAAVSILATVGCKSGNESPQSTSTDEISTSQAAPKQSIKVGLVLDSGGRDDRSFNEAAYRGALQAEKELGAEIKIVEATDDNAIESIHRSLARKNYDLIIGVGIVQEAAVKKVAARFPNVKFAIVDTEVDLPNVRSLVFDAHEGSYLVGALAAMKSKSGKLGFIGGMDIPLIRRFQMGFEGGAKSVNPDVKVVTNYIGVTSKAWNDPPKAKELALAQYGGGADVVFHVAGASGNGLFDAAEEVQKLAIGVDSNQNWIKPGRVLTSMLKKVDVAVFQTCKDVFESKFTSGSFHFGLSNDGVGYALDEHNKKMLTPEMIKRVEKIRKSILSGETQVPDYYRARKIGTS